MLRDLFSRYRFIVQCTQSSILMSMSDVIAQKFIEKRENLIKQRTFQFACVGFFVVGPLISVWYKKLDKIVPQQENQFKRSLIKVAIDQTIASPILIAVSVSALSLAQGLTISEVKVRLNENYLQILKTNYKMWPLAQFINFSLVPLKFQVLYAQVVSLIWNIYLSVKLSKKN